jgi:hypothetical protein
VALADDIRQLGVNAQAALTRVLDYYYQSRTAWELIEDDVRAGRTFTSRNLVKGTVANQAEILSRVPKYIKDYLTPAAFQQLVTIFEAWFFDLLSLWLAAHPGILYRRQVDLETILAAPDKAAVLQGVIDRELNDVKYRRVADWFDFMRKLVSVPGPSDDETAGLAEVKASRDVLVHNKSVVNAVYVAKSGAKARYAAGDILELPDPYFRGAFDLIDKVVADITAAVATRT